MNRPSIFNDVVLKTLLAELRRREDLTAYEQLGLSPDADDGAIELAYHRVRERYEPEAFFQYGDEVRDAARRLVDIVRTAYEQLSDAETRAQLASVMHDMEETADASESERVQRERAEAARAGLRANIEARIDRGRTLAAADQLDEALHVLEDAFALDRRNESLRRELAVLRKRVAAREAPHSGLGARLCRLASRRRAPA